MFRTIYNRSFSRFTPLTFSTLSFLSYQLIRPVKNDSFPTEEEEDEEERQRLVNIASKPPLSTILSIADFEHVAKQTLPPGTWGYYSTGSDDEFSLRENNYAFGRIFFRPKCLVDVSEVSTHTPLFGDDFDAPFYCTAFAGSPMAHPDAEKNLLIACMKENIPYLIPYQLSFPFAEFMQLSSSSHSNFHQVHFYTEEQLRNAPQYFANLEENHPNIKALFINVDLPCVGNREKDSKIRNSLDPLANDELSVFVSPAVKYHNITWDDMVRLRNSTKLPIVLKGVLRSEDVLKAAQIGLAGCLLSNHGGRQLDFAMPPVEILAESRTLLRKNNIRDDEFMLFIDGGVRRGSDIVKALCLGANGVGLGRPFLYAMATYGEPGVEHAIKLLKAEMVTNMKLLGVNNVSELNDSMVDIQSLKYKGIITSNHLYNLNYTDMPKPTFK